MKKPVLLIMFMLCAWMTRAQQPVIGGDVLLCPGSENGTVSVTNGVTYDAYQWFAKLYGENEFSPIDGQTSEAFTYDSNYVVSEVYLFVKQGDVSYESNTLTLDGIVFLPIYFTTEFTGNSFIDYNTGAYVICSGSSITHTLQGGFASVQWYKDGEAIEGATGASLEITAEGIYYAIVASDICPNYTEQTFESKVVWSQNCITPEPGDDDDVVVVPDPGDGDGDDDIVIVIPEPGDGEDPDNGNPNYPGDDDDIVIVLPEPGDGEVIIDPVPGDGENGEDPDGNNPNYPGDDDEVTIDPVPGDGEVIEEPTTPEEGDGIFTILPIDEDNMNVYPNPSTDEINIGFDDVNITIDSYEVIDLSGKTLKSGNVASGSKVNISDLARGTYFIKVTSKQSQASKRFIKE